MNEFDRIAAEADEGDATKIGKFNRYFESGKLRRFVICYEFIADGDEEDDATIRTTWSGHDALWAIGAAHHIEHAVERGWEDTEPD